MVGSPGWDVSRFNVGNGRVDVWLDSTIVLFAGLGTDGYADNTADRPYEWCADHNVEIPVTLPGLQDLAFGGFYSGSPYMGAAGTVPVGEGGLNPYAAFTFMWHSHAEREMVNFDIFPGGMMTMMFVEPPGTPIP